ncbi:MAG: hypothetical protein ACI8P3_001138 [Saprospiraceae bacterium]|jgi:hypothetical protein
MNKIMKISFLLLLALVIGIGTADAQNYGKKKKKKKKKPPKTEKTDDYFDESGGFAHKLWYGGGLNFQIGNYDNNSNYLLFGLSPMVGYKFTDNISIGPRVSMNYLEIYQPGDNVKVMEWGVGAFGRVKFSQALFAHIEFETLKVDELSDFNLQETNDQNFYIGVGYNSELGNGWGYEFLGLYNFMEEDDFKVPIELRVGVTYNF